MENLVLINQTFNETRVAVIENGLLSELYIDRESSTRIAGNIYKGRVGKVIPGMQAAFVNIGLERSGFISVEDVREEPIFDLFLDDEEDDTSSYLRSRARPSIQDILRDGQEVMVQVLKESVGEKGAKLTSYAAIPGKYLVFLGTLDIVGVSRKIVDETERTRLSSIIKAIKPEGVGLIARTASMGKSDTEIRGDMEYLIEMWSRVMDKYDKQKSPCLLYEEPKLYLKAARDIVSMDADKVIVDSPEVYSEIINYIQTRGDLSDVSIELYEKDEPLFDKFKLEQEIHKIYDKKVWLKSGGYLIIEEAEGLTVVDVNSGKYHSGKDQEETIFNINMEATKEIVRQIRLRNLVGIIVIDFIDLKNRELRDQIGAEFNESLKRDKARSVVLEMSTFGVVQMTRQRQRESVISELSEECDQCNGHGYIKSRETILYEILRGIKRQVAKPSIQKIVVQANPEVIERLMETEGENLKELESKNGNEIELRPIESRMDKYKIQAD